VAAGCQNSERNRTKQRQVEGPDLDLHAAPILSGSLHRKDARLRGPRCSRQNEHAEHKCRQSTYFGCKWSKQRRGHVSRVFRHLHEARQAFWFREFICKVN
jgi:hypothetical protein